MLQFQEGAAQWYLSKREKYCGYELIRNGWPSLLYAFASLLTHLLLLLKINKASLIIWRRDHHWLVHTLWTYLYTLCVHSGGRVTGSNASRGCIDDVSTTAATTCMRGRRFRQQIARRLTSQGTTASSRGFEVAYAHSSTPSASAETFSLRITQEEFAQVWFVISKYKDED